MARYPDDCARTCDLRPAPKYKCHSAHPRGIYPSECERKCALRAGENHSPPYWIKIRDVRNGR